MTNKPLTTRQKRYLRGLTHNLKPVVMVGAKGLSENVLAELDSAIEHHELIKVKISVGDRQARDQVIEQICEQVSCELVARIGNMASFYRPAKKPELTIPKNI